MHVMGMQIALMLFTGGALLALFLWNRSQLEKRFESLFKAILFDLMNASQENVIHRTQGVMEPLVSPLKEALERYDRVIREIENKRVSDFADLKSEVRQLMAAKQELQKETSNLVGALRRPRVGGSWGELTLRRVVELAGMIPYCDFEEQVSVSSEDGRFRPDMVIHLPSKRDIVVDAKVSLETYLEAVSFAEEDERNQALKRHASVMRDHLKRLTAKSYWSQFENSPEFVVMFIPGESFFSAALEHDKALLEDGMEKGVVLATPSTLIALLRAVAYGWRQEEMGRNAIEIGKLGKELHERIQKWLDHLSGLGESLEKAVKAYNASVGSLETRVLATTRKLIEFGPVENGAMEFPKPVDEGVRGMSE